MFKTLFKFEKRPSLYLQKLVVWDRHISIAFNCNGFFAVGLSQYIVRAYTV